MSNKCIICLLNLHFGQYESSNSELVPGTLQKETNRVMHHLLFRFMRSEDFPPTASSCFTLNMAGVTELHHRIKLTFTNELAELLGLRSPEWMTAYFSSSMHASAVGV